MVNIKRRSLLLLMIVSLTTHFRGGIISPILNLFIRNHGISITEIGFLGTAQMVGWLIFEPLMGIVADRIRKKYMIIGAIIGSTIIYAVYPFAKTLIQFALLGFSMSSVMSAYAISVKALTAELLPKSSRGKTYGRYLSIISFGGVLAPLLGGFMSEKMGYKIPFHVSAALGIVTLISVILMKHENQEHANLKTKTGSWSKLLTGSILSIFTIRALYLFNHVFRQQFLPVYLYESPNFSATESQIGSYMTLTGVSVAVSQAFLGGLNDRFGGRKMILICVGLLGTSYLGLIYLNGIIMLFILGILQGILLAGADMSMMIYLMSVMPESQTGMVMGLYSESENIGGILASPSLGFIYDNRGSGTSITILSLILISTSILSWFILGTSKNNSFKTSK